MADLPPIGAKARYAKFLERGAVGTVEQHGTSPTTGARMVFLRWPQGGGVWFTADEIEVVDE